MTLEELYLLETYTYKETCMFLKEKYGTVTHPYFKKNKKGNLVRTKGKADVGLHRHHVYENEIPNLSNIDIAKEYDLKYQDAENLVYCNLLEHFLLHFKINQEYDAMLGIGGDLYIIRELNDCFFKDINKTYLEPIKDLKQEYFRILKEFYNLFPQYEHIVCTGSDGVKIEEISKEVICGKDYLLDHNIPVYDEIENTLKDNQCCLVVIGTGGGKTTTALEYLSKNNIRGLVLAPNNNIKDGWNNSGLVDVESYQSLVNKYLEFDFSKYGAIICDEAHHLGSKEWTKPVKYVKENTSLKIIGLTATPYRMDGHDFVKEIFDGNICEGISVLEGIKQGIIHPFTYIGAYYDTEEIRDDWSEYNDTVLLGELDVALNNTPTVKEIFKKNMPDGKRKGLIFCSSIDAIQEAIDIVKDVYPDVEYRQIHSNMEKNEISKNKEWFANTDEGYLCAVDMISEGSHYKGVNTLIMFRRTSSKILFNQQLGRTVTLTKYMNPNSIVFDLVNNAETVSSFKEEITKVFGEKVLKEKSGRFRIPVSKSTQMIIMDYSEEISDVLEKHNSKKFRPTDTEIEIIKNNYSSLGPKKCAELLGNRYSICMISRIGKNLGLKYEFSLSDDIVKKIINDYGSITVEEICKKYNTSAYTIGKIIKENNIPMSKLTNRSKNLFTSDDDEIIKKLYPHKDKKNELLNALPGRTWTQIMNRAYALGIKQELRKVMCIETKVIFNSIKDASEKTNILRSKISVACVHGKTAGGYHWKYEDDINYSIKNKEYYNSKKIYCVELDREFDSINIASRELKISSSSIGACCRKKNITAGGYHFCYSIEKDNHTTREKKKNKNYKKVKCMETSHIYDNCAEAEINTGIRRGDISATARGVQKTAGGYHWKYME